MPSVIVDRSVLGTASRATMFLCITLIRTFHSSLHNFLRNLSVVGQSFMASAAVRINIFTHIVRCRVYRPAGPIGRGVGIPKVTWMEVFRTRTLACIIRRVLIIATAVLLAVAVDLLYGNVNLSTTTARFYAFRVCRSVFGVTRTYPFLVVTVSVIRTWGTLRRLLAHNMMSAVIIEVLLSVVYIHRMA